MSISFWPTLQTVTNGLVGSPTSIAKDSQWTIVTCTSTDASHVYASLPSGGSIGDVVEVHDSGSGWATQVVPPSGESLYGGVAVTAPRLFRKIDSSTGSYLT
jgi:hypothetical protein